jgi:gliding motility-associated-like protein
VAESDYYWLEVGNGSCSDRDTVFVGVSNVPVRPFAKDTTICLDDIETLSLDAGRWTKTIWSNGDTNQLYQAIEPGLLEVYLENEFGCYAEYDIEIINDCPSAVWIPNAFTPNGDGINEALVVMGRGVEEVQLSVFNRWGEQIWEGNQIGAEWDGTYLGNPVQQDVYVYRLLYNYINAEGIRKEKVKFGTVTVFVD